MQEIWYVTLWGMEIHRLGSSGLEFLKQNSYSRCCPPRSIWHEFRPIGFQFWSHLSLDLNLTFDIHFFTYGSSNNVDLMFVLIVTLGTLESPWQSPLALSAVGRMSWYFKERCQENCPPIGGTISWLGSIKWRGILDCGHSVVSCFKILQLWLLLEVTVTASWKYELKQSFLSYRASVRVRYHSSRKGTKTDSKKLRVTSQIAELNKSLSFLKKCYLLRVFFRCFLNIFKYILWMGWTNMQWLKWPRI